MTTQELIEAALLDALGLLEPGELAAFERAFVAAPPSIQAHVRREQTRLSQLDRLLPDVEAPAELRAAVLAAVRQAMAAGAKDASAADPNMNPVIEDSRKVSRFWRAGAIGMLAASVVLGFTTLQLRNEFTELDARLRDNMLADAALSSLGADVKELLISGELEKVRFSPAAENFEGEAALWFHPESDTAYLVCHNLPTERGRTYKLVVLDDEGQVQEALASFVSDGQLMSRKVALTVSQDARLAIMAPSSGGGEGPSTVLRTPVIQAKKG